MGLEANIAGHHPEISPTAYVHPTATVIGRVRVGDRAFVGPHAVIRADEAGPDGYYVRRITRAGAVETPVRIGWKDEGRVEIREGLTEGDEVVLEP